MCGRDVPSSLGVDSVEGLHSFLPEFTLESVHFSAF